MAIIVDPDNLDRNQVIFGTENQLISLYPVGAVVNAAFDPERSTGAAAAGLILNDAGATFQTWVVSAGDIVSIKTSQNAGHYIVLTIPSETQVTVDDVDGLLADWADTAATGMVYDIRDPTGGSLVDGGTEQVFYSFGKEEWLDDLELFGGDDLFKHPFPFEPITREQFEIGGGASHDDWDWFGNDTTERVRTGGWDDKNNAGTTQRTFSGVITLGSVDTDTQVYYQNVDAAAPIDFVLTGPVNQSILVFTDGGSDFRTFLKLFARKKARTYVQSEISDIGVASLESIVNRFPLAHVPDPAITNRDAEILGTGPFRTVQQRSTGTGGQKINTGLTFTDGAATFQADSVQPGDTLDITSGNEPEQYTILTVDSETALTIKADFEFSGFTSDESSLNYDIDTNFRVDPRTDGQVWAEVAPIGRLRSATGGLTDAGVLAGDVLVITEAADPLQGAYKVTTVVDQLILEVDTFDQGGFPGATQAAVDFEIHRPGMFLQSKDESIIASGAHTITFADADPDTLFRSTGDFLGDGVEPGDNVTITGAANAANNSCFTVASASTSTLTLVSSDALAAEAAVSVTMAVDRHFRRFVSGDTYGFTWRVYGNGASAANVFQFIQHEMRQPVDIDLSDATNRGDVTDLLMTFTTPTGIGRDMFIDDLDPNDKNSVTFDDACGVNRAFSFVAAGTIQFNANLQGDAAAEYVMFFTGTPGGTFGQPDAIVVNDASGTPISGDVSAAPSVGFDFDYDGNTQGSRTPATNAAVVIVALGLNTAQYFRGDFTITRATGLNFSLVSALERVYSNP